MVASCRRAVGACAPGATASGTTRCEDAQAAPAARWPRVWVLKLQQCLCKLMGPLTSDDSQALQEPRTVYTVCTTLCAHVESPHNAKPSALSGCQLLPSLPAFLQQVFPSQPSTWHVARGKSTDMQHAQPAPLVALWRPTSGRSAIYVGRGPRMVTTTHRTQHSRLLLLPAVHVHAQPQPWQRSWGGGRPVCPSVAAREHTPHATRRRQTSHVAATTAALAWGPPLSLSLPALSPGGLPSQGPKKERPRKWPVSRFALVRSCQGRASACPSAPISP